MSIQSICIDDSCKPREIPPSKWVKKDGVYTITHIFWHVQQKIQGVELAEIMLDSSCFPYESFSIKRFAIPLEEMDKLEQMLKDCTELNSVEINTFINELEII